jgi:hypothetical protein
VVGSYPLVAFFWSIFEPELPFTFHLSPFAFFLYEVSCAVASARKDLQFKPARRRALEASPKKRGPIPSGG